MHPVRWLVFVAVALVRLPALAAEPAANVSSRGDSPLAIRAWFTAERGTGVVSVQATLADGWHTYSVTDSAKAQRTQITLAPSGQYHQSGAIRPIAAPELTYDIQSLQTVEKHRGVVTWTLPIRFAEGVDPARVQVAGLIELQAWSAGASQPISMTFSAAYAAPITAPSTPSPAAAGEESAIQLATALQQDKFEDILGGGFSGPGGGAGDKVSITATVEPAQGDKPAQLVIEATIKSPWHIYSLTQPKDAQLPTKIDVKLINAELAGPFHTDPPPKKVYSDVFKVTAEEHSGKVSWTAPLKIAAAAESEGYKVEGNVSIQACTEGACVSEDHKFIAADTTKKSAAHVGEYRPQSSSVTIRGYLEPGTVASGGTAKLVLTAEPQGKYHVYAVKDDKWKPAKPTLIVVSDKPEGWSVAAPAASTQPVANEGNPYHEGSVTWTVEVKVPSDAKPGAYKLGGGIAYLACASALVCERPTGASYEVVIDVGGKSASDRPPLRFFSAEYDEVERRTLSAAALASRDALRERVRPVVDDVIRAQGVELYSHGMLGTYSGVALDKLPKSGASSGSDLLTVVLALGGGFLGGLLLNVMPCVLPVIGLKLMSFLQQGGEDRRRVLMLNVWFSLGLISVFLVLAAMAAFLNLGWGSQFQQGWFTIVLACIVFAFALAMVGVWEVPIPGFIGSSGAVTNLATKEGPAGAFSKGVLTTVLATPCTGPFLGPALAWAVKQPLPLVFGTFLAVGIGMASPYLLIGAFPKLIAFLPKPGEWMETFKKLMGFVLLATVVWLLSFVPATDVVPTITVMCGLGAALWWIGHVPLTEPAGKRVLAWVQGAAVIVGVSVFSFGWFNDVMKDRAARRFKSDLVSELVKFRDKPEEHQTAVRPSGHYTVMVDFTADWCPTCKTNEQFVLSSKKTKELIDQNNIVFLVADITSKNPEAEDLLVRLGNEQRTIPYVAIFPADNPNQPIVLDGLLTQGQLTKALEQAGPSKVAGGTTAMRTP